MLGLSSLLPARRAAILSTALACLALPAACSGSDGGSFGDDGAGGSSLPTGKCRTYLDGCEGTCVAEDDVACFAPVAPETTCINDPDCEGIGDATTVCAVLAATCPSGGQAVCVTGCKASAECPVGQVCQGHHCVKQPCGCPLNFLCGGEGHCVRAACKADSDCEKAGSYCVNGLCHEELGTCAPK